MQNEDRKIQHRNCGCENHKNHHRFSRCNCLRRFHLNFAGLTDNLNAKLLKNRQKSIVIVTSNGSEFKGKTDNVGIDYVDIKSEYGVVVTVLKDKIDHIKWFKQQHFEDQEDHEDQEDLNDHEKHEHHVHNKHHSHQKHRKHLKRKKHHKHQKHH